MRCSGSVITERVLVIIIQMVTLINRSSSSCGGGGGGSSSSRSRILYPTYLLLLSDNINIRSAKDRLKVSVRFKVKMYLYCEN